VAALADSSGRQTKIHTDGIIIDVKKCKHTEPDQLPKKFFLEKAKTVEHKDGIYYHSEHSFLSNIHSSPIADNDLIYMSAEHMYQAEKCKAIGYQSRQQRVRQETTPLEEKTNC
jgi:hypothetical protein